MSAEADCTIRINFKIFVWPFSEKYEMCKAAPIYTLSGHIKRYRKVIRFSKFNEKAQIISTPGGLFKPPCTCEASIHWDSARIGKGEISDQATLAQSAACHSWAYKGRTGDCPKLVKLPTFLQLRKTETCDSVAAKPLEDAPISQWDVDAGFCQCL